MLDAESRFAGLFAGPSNCTMPGGSKSTPNVFVADVSALPSASAVIIRSALVLKVCVGVIPLVDVTVAKAAVAGAAAWNVTVTPPTPPLSRFEVLLLVHGGLLSGA